MTAPLEPAVDLAAPIEGPRPDTATERSDDQDRIVRSSAAVAAGTALSRVTGLARVGLLAYALGRGTLADTYNIANSTPNIVYELLLGGVLSATLVPLFVEHRKDRRATDAVFTVALTALTAITVIAVIAAPWIAHLYTMRGGDERQADVATAFVRLLLPQMVFYGLAALATALLNSRRRFAAAAFAPAVNNVVVIATLLWFVGATDGGRRSWVDVGRIEGRTGLILLLGLGTTAGIAAMALVLIPALRRTGVRLRPRFEWRHPAVLTMLRLSGWTVGYVIANQVALSVVIVMANGVSGGVAAYTYAFIFFQLPHGLFAVSIMTTVTPELARHAQSGDRVAFRAQYESGLRMLTLVVLPAAIAYTALAEQFVGLMRVGAFTHRDVVFTAQTLSGFALGLVFFSVYLYTLRGFYALQDTRTPFFINLFENGLNIVLALALFQVLDVRGLAIAYSASYLVASIVAVKLLDRRLGVARSRRTTRTIVRIAVASAAVAIVMIPFAIGFTAETPAGAFGVLVLAGTLGLAVYTAMLRLFHVQELGDVIGAFRRRPATAAT